MKIKFIRPMHGYPVGKIVDVNPQSSQVRALLDQGKVVVVQESAEPAPTTRLEVVVPEAPAELPDALKVPLSDTAAHEPIVDGFRRGPGRPPKKVE
jgi:hypothetical protein